MNTRLILTLLWVVTAQCVSGQDTIYWQPAGKLQWQDFEGKADTASRFSAATSSGIVWSYAFQGGIFSFASKAYFAKKRSWKRGQPTSRMLQHEQGHFDITEIFARKLRQKVNNMSHERTFFEQTIEAVVANLLKEKDAMQRQYDLQTNYGTNYSAQQGWLRKIGGAMGAD